MDEPTESDRSSLEALAQAGVAADVVSEDQQQPGIQIELAATEEVNPASELLIDTGDHTGPDDAQGIEVSQEQKEATTDGALPTDASEAAISSNEPSLADLRQKVLDQRGTKSQLPPGWDDDEAAVPDAVSSTAEEAVVSATKQADSDSDSDSDTESSSSSSSSASDSSDDEDDVKAKADMVSDYDSDEDGPSRRKEDGEDSSRGPTTKNELQQTKASKLFGQLPFETVPEDVLSTITPLGKIHGRVQEVLVIAQHPENLPGSKASGPLTSIAGPSTSYPSTYASHNERQGPILDAGSLVCFQDGQVLGLVFETFGSLLSPLYSVILSESPAGENSELETKYAKDTPIFFLPSRSTILRPAELRAQQGKPSDASNVHDEEPNEWEIDQMDFSDDEEEAEFKRRLKEKRKGGAGKRNANDDSSAAQRGGKSKRGKGRGGGGAQQQQQGRSSSNAAATLPHALPARPNWQLDDPAGEHGGALQYSESASANGTNVPDGRSANLRPYNDEAIASGDAPLPKAPPSARPPPMPASTAEPTATQSQPQPQPSSSSSNGASYHPQQPPAQPYHPQPSPATAAPGAGGAIHINPLFAHRFFGQGQGAPSAGYQQQQQSPQQPYAAYPQPQHQQPQQYATPQGYPAYPQQQQYPMQGAQAQAQAGWNSHEQYGAYPQHQQQPYGGQAQYYPYQYQQQFQPQQQQGWPPYHAQQMPQNAYPYPSGGQGQGQGPTYDPTRPS